ncbi:MAG: hypothetical protein KAR40_14435 [Candidatus Sabulitectum sp.]|nr:hypothetical protein [Candidatus Sabulitectum sp.]
MDFERMWLDNLSRQLEELKGEEFSDTVMKGSEKLDSATAPENVIRWTAGVVKKMKEELSDEELHDVVTCCACHYPGEKLLPVRDAFRERGDFHEAIDLLREQFVESMRDEMHLDMEVVDKLLEMGMGVAGVLDGNRIIATKIPRSGNLRKWLSGKDPQERRKIYCHCPRVNEAVNHGIEMPVEYCLCGAGFYRDIWETITESPVRVEVIESVFAGDDFCRVAIYPLIVRG